VEEILSRVADYPILADRPGSDETTANSLLRNLLLSPRESPALTQGVHLGTIVYSTVEKRFSVNFLMKFRHTLGSPSVHLECHPFLTEAA
jgi:hypothetical protein